MLTQQQLTAYVEKMRRAAEGAEQRPEQWDWLRRRLAARPLAKPHWAAELCQAYEEATGTCIGCD